MKINILNKKRNQYEVGDLIKLGSGKYVMIIEGVYGDGYALMHVDGQIISCWYSTIGELLEGLHIVEHYKNNELQISLENRII